MTHHENEGFIDKVKNALGMGDDHEEHDHDEDDHAGHDHAPASTVDPALTAHDSADAANRPAGPDLGADDTTRGSIADPAVADGVADSDDEVITTERRDI